MNKYSNRDITAGEGRDRAFTTNPEWIFAWRQQLMEASASRVQF